jgi:3-hydroxybutyrate dehydrogenase
MPDQTRRVAIVTGAAGGIGAAITHRLVQEGVNVVAADLDGATIPVGAGRGDVAALAADLTTREGNQSVVRTALEEFGRLDMIVANAGFQHVSPIVDFPEDRWDALLSLMLTSPFLLAKYAWPSLVSAPGGGRFLVIASAHALVASPFKAGYVAAKHGVLGLVKTLALEGAEHDICATAICPAYVRTPMVEKQVAAQATAHGMSEDRVLQEVILAAQPVKRLIEPEEVAELAAFLLGPHGRSFTGVPVSMDQGWTAR